MKIKMLLAGFVVCGAIMPAWAQQPSHLSVSPSVVHPGQTLSLTYDPAGTKLEKSQALNVTGWLFGPKGIPAAVDVNFTKSGNVWKASLPLADSVSLAAFKFADATNAELVDDSSPKAYYADVVNTAGKPVKGNQYAHALISASLASLVGGKVNVPDGEASLRAELAAYPENTAVAKSFGRSLVVASKDPVRIAAAKAEAWKELNNPGISEADANAAAVIIASGDKSAGDSVNAILKQRFPNGSRASYDDYMAFAKAADLPTKAAMYEKAVQQGRTAYQQAMLSMLVQGYAQAADAANTEKYAGMLKDKSNLPAIYNNIAWNNAEKGTNVEFSAALSKKSLDLLDAMKANPTNIPSTYYPLSFRQKNLQSTYAMYADTYAFLLYQQGKVADALKYQQIAVTDRANASADVLERYALYQEKSGDPKEARKTLESAIAAGKSTAAMKAQLKGIYTKEKGSETGYDAYAASLESAAKTKAHQDLLAQMLDLQAPTFALKDFEGNTVSLASLKGKVVVIDFWATWCGPCKASFPGMQLAVTRYKDNPNVKFLFIDTWEREDNYPALAKQFIADNKYTFHVLFDQENKATKRHGKIVEDYGVDGIPTKFVIDGTGKIRFKSVGFSGNTDGLADEISAMIDIAANPPVTAMDK